MSVADLSLLESLPQAIAESLSNQPNSQLDTKTGTFKLSRSGTVYFICRGRRCCRSVSGNRAKWRSRVVDEPLGERQERGRTRTKGNFSFGGDTGLFSNGIGTADNLTGHKGLGFGGGNGKDRWEYANRNIKTGGNMRTASVGNIERLRRALK